MSGTRFTQHVTTVGRWLIVGVMLVLYGAVSTQTGYVHTLFHPDEAATHTTKDEEDACHRALYHGIADGCDHTFHLAKIKNCGFTHILAQTDTEPAFPAGLPLPDFDSEVIAEARVQPGSTTTLIILSRGPPTVLLSI